MGERISFTYRFGIGDEVPCEATVRQVCREKSGYGIECSGANRSPQKNRKFPLFWAYNISSNIRNVATGDELPVREWMAQHLGIPPLEFYIMWRLQQSRYLQLIADFSQGHAQGWRFPLGACFRDQLDIRYVDLVQQNDQDKTKQDVEKRWTQGPFYNFAEGHMIYDVLGTYQQVWKEALQSINVALHVIRATPNGQGKPGRIKSGLVDFALMAPNQERSCLCNVGIFSATQNEFVHFLKTGVLRGRTLEDMLTEEEGRT